MATRKRMSKNGDRTFGPKNKPKKGMKRRQVRGGVY